MGERKRENLISDGLVHAQHRSTKGAEHTPLLLSKSARIRPENCCNISYVVVSVSWI